MDLAARCVPETCDRLDQLVLAVPGYAGNAQDFASPDAEAYAPDSLLAAIRFDLQILDR